jgi:hypothetical protein
VPFVYIYYLPAKGRVDGCASPVGSAGRRWVGPVAWGGSESIRFAGENRSEGRDARVSALVSCYSRLAIRWSGLRYGQHAPSGSVPGSCCVGRFGQQSCAGGVTWYWIGSTRCVFAILTKWFSMTRLETRTKESNIYASIWVAKPWVRNESEGSLVLLR